MDEAGMIDMLADMVGYSVPEEEIQLALVRNDGDITKTLDELLSLMAINELDKTIENTQQDGQLQWELFTNELGSYGLDEHATNDLIQTLKERKGFERLMSSSLVMELMDVMDEVEDHPLKELQARFPSIPLDIIQESYECHEYDIKQTIQALNETKKLLDETGGIQTFSYASVLKPKTETTAPPPTPLFDNKYQFPTLQRFELGKKSSDPSSVWHRKLHSLPGGQATLTTRLKFEKLQESFPTIDSDVLCAALLVSNSSVVAAEAILESIFPSACEKPNEECVEIEQIQDTENEEWNNDVHDFAYYQCETQKLQEEMQALHSEALRKFSGKYNHFLGRERIHRLSELRHTLQNTRQHAAYAFFRENQFNLINGIQIDLHGLYVQEAYHVLDYCLNFCREQRINKFKLITGIGNSSDRGGKMYTTFPTALRRRHIRHIQDGGQLVIYPLDKMK